MPSRVVVRSVVTLAMLVGTLMPAGISPVFAIGPAIHDVATCADLNILGADPSASADTINLTADLDCTGVTFVAMFGGGFSGTFDGHGHSISHLTINMPGNYNVGLFSGTSGATITNLTLASGSVTGSNATGALIGDATGTTVTNVNSAVDVNSAGDQTGGLIGQVANHGTTLIRDVHVTGDVTNTGDMFGFPGGGSNIAGLIGYVLTGDNDSLTLERVSYDATISAINHGRRVGGLLGVVLVMGNSGPSAVTISDSYAAGAVSTVGHNEVGGLVASGIALGNGATSYITLNRVYSSNAVTGTDGVGGLFGIINTTHAGDAVTINVSFAAGPITATVANGGGLVGSNSADPPTVLTVNNSFYDGPGTGQTVCAGLLTPTGACPRIDTATQPGYFKGNHSNAPFAPWDFSTVWMTNPGAYPTLLPRDDGDGISLADEAAAPNSGDANGDGTADAAQGNVASFPDPVTGHYAMLESSCGSLFNAAVGAEPTTAGQTDVAYNYPGGLIRFVATGCTPGATATITQYFYGLSNPGTYVMRKWDSGHNTYTTVSGAAFSTATVGGQTAVKAVYQVTDGSSMDQDGLPDGNIVDPAGPAVNVLGVPNTGLGGSRR